jgi:hypothetical protein
MVVIGGGAGLPFDFDADESSISDFDIQVRFFECDNPEVEPCVVDFNGTTDQN